MRDAFQALLAKLDADAGTTGGSADFEATLAMEPVRENDKKTSL